MDLNNSDLRELHSKVDWNRKHLRPSPLFEDDDQNSLKNLALGSLAFAGVCYTIKWTSQLLTKKRTNYSKVNSNFDPQIYEREFLMFLEG